MQATLLRKGSEPTWLLRIPSISQPQSQSRNRRKVAIANPFDLQHTPQTVLDSFTTRCLLKAMPLPCKTLGRHGENTSNDLLSSPQTPLMLTWSMPPMEASCQPQLAHPHDALSWRHDRH
eukprot:5471426-Amphidinium_carterae.2